MKTLSIFNNKGGVGKTTLAYHLGYALSEIGQKVLLIDLDPQANLSLFALTPEALETLWDVEEPFIEDFESARSRLTQQEFETTLLSNPRSIHFHLKPAEDGTNDVSRLPPPVGITPTLSLIPGRLSLYSYEATMASRWSDLYRGEPLALRQANRIRKIYLDYAKQHAFDCIIIDTSPSLGQLNKLILSTSDYFLVPCFPDMFSLYGIRNIGRAMDSWQEDFARINMLLTSTKKTSFPPFVKFIGYSIVNARRYGSSNKYGIAQAHYNYTVKIPASIKKYIKNKVGALDYAAPIDTSIMYSYNTFPSQSQKYRQPIWKLPDCTELESDDKNTILLNKQRYLNVGSDYRKFAVEVLKRFV